MKWFANGGVEMQRSTPRSLVVGLAVLASTILVVATARATHGSYIADPTASGPFPVGVTTTLLVDYSRKDALTKEPRTLVTEIWYPATDETKGMPKGKFSQFMPGGLSPMLGALLKSAYKLTIDEIDTKFVNQAVRDARVRDGRFPVVFFSHGNQGFRFQNTFWCDFLASHGFVVVSADHTGNAAITIINGKAVLFSGGEREHSAEDRPRDMSFLLSQMTSWNAGGDSRFSRKLDLTKPVAAGMSFGSFTAIKAADLDPRFQAVIAMAYAPAEGHTNTVPTLFMLGEEDATIGVKGNEAIRANFAAHKGTGYLLSMKRGGHYSFTDMGKLNPNYGDGVGTGKQRESGEPYMFTPTESAWKMINSYSLAFLNTFIRGDREFASFLTRSSWPGRNGMADRRRDYNW
jgi:dienelactone hydrolase